ncbi:MAG: CvpA family protein [Gammaproteobacteria bacterium]|nr:CvpA family protein [Gammaproteobacteria bacterium]
MDIFSYFNWFDYTLIAIVIFSLLIGLMRGMLRELLSLATWLAAILVAIFFSSHLAGFFGQHIKSPIFASILSFILLFFITFIIGTLVNYIISGLAGKSGVLFIDRLLGALFGFIRGVVIALFMILVIINTGFKKADWFTQSLSSKQLSSMVENLTKEFIAPIMQKKHPVGEIKSLTSDIAKNK